MSRRQVDILLAAVLGIVICAWNLPFWADVLGLTYDEPVYAAVGERHLGWYGQLLHFDLSAFSLASLEQHWGNSGKTPVEADWHPPVGKVLLALCRRLPVPGLFAQYRCGNVFLFAGTAGLLFLWLTPLAGRLAGLSAAMVWVTLPRAVFHGNLAGIDLPVAFFATLALCAGHRLLVKPSRKSALLYGVALGLAGATKFNAVLVVPVVLVLCCRHRDALKWVLLSTFVVAPLTFWLLWPWLWYDGFHHLAQVLAFHGKHGYIATEYFGTIYTDPPPPWHYPWVMLAITTPLLVLLAAVLAGADREPTHRDIARLFLLGVVFNLLPFSLPAAAKYNGVRLFLPALPLLAGLSGLGWAWLMHRLLARLQLSDGLRRDLRVVSVILLAMPGLIEGMAVYPHPSAAYSFLVDGVHGAEKKGLELSYWGDPFRGCCAWLSQHAPRAAVVYLQPPGAIAMVEMYRGTGLLRDDIVLSHGEEARQSAAYFVYQNRRSEWDPLGFALAARAKPALTVLAGDAPVAFIWPGEAGRETVVGE